MSSRNAFSIGCCCGMDACDASQDKKIPLLMLMAVTAIVAGGLAVAFLPALAAGVVCGALGLAVLVWVVMPKLMIVRHTSRFGLDETIEKLVAAIEARGWTVPAVRDMNKSMAAQGVEFARPVRLVELCKAEYASGVLAGNRHLATLMPCAFAVYEDDAGRVRVSGMNTGLMGRMFGGEVAEIMGSKVAADEKAFLKAVV